MLPPVPPSVYKRLSLLKRNPELSRDQFFMHYEFVHGPLASRQQGFRKFTYCYVQNHVLGEVNSPEAPEFDGMTATFQVPRADMTRGFFQEPDYANFVRPDEERVFDMAKTRSVMTSERLVVESERSAWKCLLLFSAKTPADEEAELSRWADRGICRLVVNAFVSGSAGALGGVPAEFPFDRIAEFWFTDQAAMTHAERDRLVERFGGRRERRAHLFHVREVVMFASPRPVEGSMTA